ncbi:uncharacterized protein cubi_02678 [Cryptosporidium ubiquitum]|uniref:Uncharacterized protein n=1 Tax=Cryptosporidium ubiquitum TaxID=857276 RepID=A0A1J4MLH6_9CRYT|nr:uncharacterized protein cubi_02678 [Cryptosporidium ubiquitum]OII73876.1 hypothetical protein cubi_02678 [Cryptosporidium ubiquitum]
MAQQYIYNKDYINQINEQVYREIGIPYDLEHFVRKGIKPNNYEDLIIHNSTTYGSQPIRNVMPENATDGKLNSIIGFGVVVLTLLIIYFFNKILFWLIVIFSIVCYFFFANKILENIETGDKKLPF